MATITSGTFSYLKDRDFDKLFYDKYDSIARIYPTIFEVGNTTEPYIRVGQVNGFGPMLPTGEDSPYYQMIPTQQGTKTITYTEYTGGFEYGRVAMEDDYNGLIRQMPGALGLSATTTMEALAADVLNTGFVTTYRTGLDGAALFSASHTTTGAGGSTQSNTGTNAALSIYSLRSMKIQAKKLKNYNGQPTPQTLETLMVPPELEDIAENLRLATMNPHTADNELNLFSKTLKVIVNPYLTSTTAYFAFAAKKDLQAKFRRTLTTTTADVPQTGAKLHYVHFRGVFYFIDWRGCWGNAGV